MPLSIIRQDITKMDCDIIVNATNRHMTCDEGVAAAILEAAGDELRFYLLGIIDVGDVWVTPAFNLPCKRIFHMVGPIWRGGYYLEKEQLALCYKNALEKAVEIGAGSIAFPLISSGSRGFPKEYVLNIAVETIADFLQDNELDVYLVVYDKNSYSIGKDLYGDITEYINDNYIAENEDAQDGSRDHIIGYCIEAELPFLDFESHKKAQPAHRGKSDDARDTANCRVKPMISTRRIAPAPPVMKAPAMPPNMPKGDDASNIARILEQADDSFAETLFKLIQVRNMSDPECYKKANVSKQTFHKIVSDKNYKPSKTTVIAFAIALELNLEETKHLLETVGFALSRSIKFDLIIEYFISHGEYDIFKINDVLFKFDQVLLGV